MNQTKIEWVKNPDGSQGYTWNPITGCLNGCPYCYARKLAEGRLRQKYLANFNVIKGDIPIDYPGLAELTRRQNNPFYPRFWSERLDDPIHNFRFHHIPGGQRYRDRGIFVCDMSDLFGIGIPHEWTEQILETIKQCPHDRFYLLTKQPQNLIKFSPFPDNCWVGVTLTTIGQHLALFDSSFKNIKAKIKYVSLEPLLENLYFHPEDIKKLGINWLIIGAQTKPYKPPEIEWVKEIVQACDKAGMPVFLKNNLIKAIPFFKEPFKSEKMGEDGIKVVSLRQEMPSLTKERQM